MSLSSVTPRTRLFHRLKSVDDLIRSIIVSIDATTLEKLSLPLIGGLDRDAFIRRFLAVLETGSDPIHARSLAVALGSLFRAVDLNESGLVDFNEFLDALVLYGQHGRGSGQHLALQPATQYRPRAVASIGGQRRRPKRLLHSTELGGLVLAHVDGQRHVSVFDAVQLRHLGRVGLSRGDVNSMIVVALAECPALLLTGTSTTVEVRPLIFSGGSAAPATSTTSSGSSSVPVAGACTSLAALPSRRMVVVGLQDGALALFRYGADASLRLVQCAIPHIHRDEITSICSISSSMFISGSLDRTIQIWSISESYNDTDYDVKDQERIQVSDIIMMTNDI